MRLSFFHISANLYQANMDWDTNMEFVSPVDGKSTTTTGPIHDTHQSSLLNDTARAALIGQYRGQTGQSL
jgi:hypothetical protein